MLPTMHPSDDVQADERLPLTVEELLAAAEPVIWQVCHTISLRFCGYVEHEDAAQECRLWCWRHRKKLADWLDVDDHRGRSAGTKQLARSLTRELERMARKDRAASLGYRPEDEWFANRGVIQELLPVILAGGYDGLEKEQASSDLRSNSDPAEGNGKHALLADVQAAWKAHPSPLLERLYYTDTHMTRKEMAEEYNITPATLQKRENRALDLMIRFLGGENPYV